MPAISRLTAIEKRQLELKAEDIERQKGYKICGARTKQGGVCSLRAGFRTDHLTVGRCFKHGGRLQSPGSAVFKHGKNAQLYHASIQEKVEQLKQDRDVFDLRNHIFYIEAVAQTLLEEADNPQNLFDLVKVIDTATKVIQRLHEIEVGRRYVISVENLGGVINRVIEVIERHVPDPYLRSLIADDLLKINNYPMLSAKAVDIETIDQR